MLWALDASTGTVLNGGSPLLLTNGPIRVPPTIDGNEQAILAMRVDRGPVTCADVGSSLPYECVLPIIYRGEVDGFLLLNDKADKEAYRPDQIELIAFAVQQIGLDLTALEREQYKQQASEFQVAATSARSVSSPPPRYVEKTMPPWGFSRVTKASAFERRPSNPDSVGKSPE